VEQRPKQSKRKDEPSLGARALRLLARREHSRQELEQKLAAYTDDIGAIQSLLDDFTSRGWLCDARVAEQLVRAKKRRFGPARIRQTLRQKGVPEHLIGPALANLKIDEFQSAHAVWVRKFRALPDTPADRARQVRFLQSRGFSVEVAMRVVAGESTDET
jgi:regulatory protein